MSIPVTATEKALVTPASLDYLDGLRALAVLWVLLAHTVMYGLGGDVCHGAWPQRVLTGWLYYVHSAVSVFIVLSGYCLAISVVKRGQVEGGALAFFLKRARRILPPFYAALALSVVFGLLNGWVRGNWPACLWSNVLLLQDVLDDQNVFNGPLWTVALEWKIYFLFPLLASLLLRFGRRSVLLVTAIGGFSTAWAMNLWYVHHHQAVYWHTCPWYLFLFGMGVVGASVTTADVNSPAGRAAQARLAVAALLLLAVTLWHSPVQDDYERYVQAWPLYDVAVGTLTALLVVRCRMGQTPRLLRALSWRPLVVIGTFSYSVYLVHFPLLILIQNRVVHTLPVGRPLGVVLTITLGVPVILGFSYLFFWAYERPFLSTRPQERLTGLAQDAVLSPAP